MTLYALDGWWFAFYIIGAFVLALFMVEAMMQFTSVLLERPPTRRQRKVVPLPQLRDELLAIRSDYYVVEPRGAVGLAVHWDVLGGVPAPPGLRVKLTTTWKTSMLLDERRHEARWFESVRTSSAFVGFAGWHPLLRFGWYYQGGYLSGVWSGRAYLVTDGFPPRIAGEQSFSIDTDLLREAFVDCVTESGWTFRPVTLPFYTSPPWLALTERIVPDRLARVPRKILWGVLYPATYVLLILFLLSPLEGLSWHDLVLVSLISAAWWSIWCAIAWLISRSPNRRRRARRRT